MSAPLLSKKPEVEYLVDLHRLWVRPRQRRWRFGFLVDDVTGKVCGAVVHGEGKKDLRRNARLVWHQEQKRGATGDPILILSETAEPTSKDLATGWVILRCLNCGERLAAIKYGRGGSDVHIDYGDRPRADGVHLLRLGVRHRFAATGSAQRITCGECKEKAEWTPCQLAGNWLRYRIITPGQSGG